MPDHEHDYEQMTLRLSELGVARRRRLYMCVVCHKLMPWWEQSFLVHVLRRWTVDLVRGER